MRPRFREDKATQAAARLLKMHGGRMSHVKLLKLLYLADREALGRYGRPITFDWYYSMPHGPVPSFTYDLIQCEPDPENLSYWQEHISEREEHQVSLKVHEPPVDQLSEAEEGLLDQIFSEYGKLDRWQLRDFSHTLPEWQDPAGSSLPISIEDILRAHGFGRDDIDEILGNLRAEAAAGEMFG